MTKYVVSEFTLKCFSDQYGLERKTSFAELKNRALQIITSKYLGKLPFIKIVVHFSDQHGGRVRKFVMVVEFQKYSSDVISLPVAMTI